MRCSSKAGVGPNTWLDAGVRGRRGLAVRFGILLELGGCYPVRARIRDGVVDLDRFILGLRARGGDDCQLCV